ncbi:MAG TPA: aldolase/citrate lyase family protein [Ramlibacter sp.]|nr:aldolase/citrate lyase family protein [Ramlibacter sp.]
MKEYRNIAKERLLRGEMTFGFQIRVFRELEMARAISASGFHFAFIDLEHTALEVSDAGRLAIALGDAGVTPIARIPERDWATAGRLIDGGLQGIVVPHVDTPQQAREAVANCKYRPIGERYRGDNSIHFGWAPPPGGKSLVEALNEIMMLVVMIESEEAVENIEAIAATPGVDVISVGTSDLTSSMKVNGDFGHPKVIAAWKRIAEAAKKNGKGLRLGGVKKREDILKTYELGSRMVIAGNDMTTMVKGMRADLEALQAGAAGF